MGQYFKPLALENEGSNKILGFLHARDYNTFLKLTEHGYLDCTFPMTVETLLIAGGAWHMKPIVWAGDYAPFEPETIAYEAVEGLFNEDGSQYMKESGENLWHWCEENEDLAIKPKAATQKALKGFHFIVNHTKKEFVDKRKVPVNDTYEWFTKTGKKRTVVFKYHPLALMTAEGNGKGGGDFFGADPKGLVGSWARNVLSVEKEIPEGYSEVIFDLTDAGVPLLAAANESVLS